VTEFGVEIGRSALAANIADRHATVRFDPVDDVRIEQHVVSGDNCPKLVTREVDLDRHF
jgi:hypothetical protein